jgi:LysM repeat protein
MSTLPAKVLGTYWPEWNAPVLSTIPSGYNTVWLFAATPTSGGAVAWSQNRESTAQFKTDLAAIRAAGRCAILSVGGANAYIDLSTQARADAFITSVKGIYTQLGGFDGIDFDIESGTVYPIQLVYIARTLKSIYGSSFAITYCPAPWSSSDRAAVRALYTAGVLDLVSPQYYELSGLTTEASKVANVVNSITNSWLPQVNGDASKIGLGYGIASAVSETMTIPSFVTAWLTLSKTYPALRGVFSWEAHADSTELWLFETAMVPIVVGILPTKPTTYIVKTGDTWASIATANSVTLPALMTANPPTPGEIVTL